MKMMEINKIKVYRQILWLFAFLWKPVFKIEQKILKKCKSCKKRLFITTGNISLINILALLNNLENDGYEDYLIIESTTGTNKFWEINSNIAKKYKFKKIFLFYSIRFDTAFILNNLFDFDEVFVLNKKDQIETIKELLPSTIINLYEEGAGSLANFKNCNDLNINKFYTHKYLDKLDGLNMPINVSEKMQFQDTKAFNEIAEQITQEYPLNINFNNEDKSVIFCGTYWNPRLDPPKEEFEQSQLELINSLTDCGYKIYYKPHPRAEELYGLDKNSNVQMLDSVIPIELCNIDVLAIVSSSTCCIAPAHYWGIPCFSDISEYSLEQNNELGINIFRFIIKEYSPDYRELLKIDTKNLSREEVKTKIKEIYDNYLKDKPDLSVNKRVIDYAKRFKS